MPVEKEVIIGVDSECITLTSGLGVRNIPRKLVIIFYPNKECLMRGIGINNIVRLQETGDARFPDVYLLTPSLQPTQ